MRNTYGEFVPGASVPTPMSLVSVPITGQERLILPEGLRNEDTRKFYVIGDIVGLHYGLADGDQFILGQLGPSQNTFSESTMADAELARDAYGIVNPTWLTSYQFSTANRILLRGFGEPVYQRYDAIDGHWANADIYRAYLPQRWGAFTEITAMRRDPGNV